MEFARALCPILAIDAKISKFGGDEEDRTPDLGIANAALSQLSYIPNGGDFSVLIRICEAVWRVLV